MELKVSVNNSGIESAGLTSDYMQAIAEYLWNGFDAGASHLRIDFAANVLDHLTEFAISDNGAGLDPSGCNQALVPKIIFCSYQTDFTGKLRMCCIDHIVVLLNNDRRRYF
jgi:Histidine kinase-, DNA gyrase B-, and HSP90-like ATPase